MLIDREGNFFYKDQYSFRPRDKWWSSGISMKWNSNGAISVGDSLIYGNHTLGGEEYDY